MSDDSPTFQEFGDSVQLLVAIKEKSDDIEKAIIPMSPMVFTSPGGRRIGPIPQLGMVLEMVNGEKILITKEDAQLVLNDGILNRMKIRIELGG